ncbi:MAG: cation:H+ antiporter [Ilumatobacter sp.]|jgi:cation:H+ antiporter
MDILMWIAIAAVGSVPDALISINLARKSEGVVSLSNVLGSNIFDLSITGTVAIQFDLAMPLVVFLAIATVVLFNQVRTGFVLSRRESYVLFGLYVLFIVWLILEQADVTSVLPDQVELGE